MSKAATLDGILNPDEIQLLEHSGMRGIGKHTVTQARFDLDDIGQEMRDQHEIGNRVLESMLAAIMVKILKAVQRDREDEE